MATCSTCSECTYLDLNKEYSSSDGRFWCENTLDWHYANEAACRRECYAYGRSSSAAKSYKEHSERCQSSGGGCYLTTITCEILGLPDDNVYLRTLRKFRKEKLQKDDKYKEILVQYDIVGPIIAERLRCEERNGVIAKNLLNLGISKTVFQIFNGQDLEAIKTYTTMTELLIQACEIDVELTKEQIDAADITKSGHGMYVKTAKVG